MKILDILTPKRLTGNLGERAAVRLLRRTGYRILEKNYVALGSEIDIIASKRGVTAFIEVKTRNIKSIGLKEPRPASAVDSEKQRKIIKVASYYTAHHPSKNRYRFDVIEVYVEGEGKGQRVKETRHLEACFDKSTAFDSKYYFKRSKEGSRL